MRTETRKPQCQTTLDLYKKLFQKLSRRTLPLLEECFDPLAKCQTPRQEFSTPQEMLIDFESVISGQDSFRFEWDNDSWAEREGEICAYLKWNYVLKKANRETKRQGVTEIVFTDSGKILTHIEFWGKDLTTSQGGGSVFWDALRRWFKNKLITPGTKTHLGTDL